MVRVVDGPVVDGLKDWKDLRINLLFFLSGLVSFLLELVVFFIRISFFFQKALIFTG
jgi:hypothetical protein